MGYLLPKDSAPGRRDPDFQGYGQARTDAAGAYKFRTIRPVPYESRPPHIHFQVTHPRFRPLVFGGPIPGVAANALAVTAVGEFVASVVLYTHADGAEPGDLPARFDIVLIPAR